MEVKKLVGPSFKPKAPETKKETTDFDFDYLSGNTKAEKTSSLDFGSMGGFDMGISSSQSQPVRNNQPMQME